MTSKTNCCRLDSAFVHVLGTPLGGRGRGIGEHSQSWEVIDMSPRCGEVWKEMALFTLLSSGREVKDEPCEVLAILCYVGGKRPAWEESDQASPPASSSFLEDCLLYASVEEGFLRIQHT